MRMLLLADMILQYNLYQFIKIQRGTSARKFIQKVKFRKNSLAFNREHKQPNMDYKNNKRCQPLCSDHQFFIQHPVNTRYNAVVTFCPKFHRQPRPLEHTYPVFNQDGKYYTSAFILGTDARTLQHNDAQELNDHNKHMKDMLEKKGKIAFPKPNKKHTVCAVCRQKYTNYKHHIMSEEHKLKINANAFNGYILELQDKYKDLHVMKAPEPLELIDIQRSVKSQEDSNIDLSERK